MAPRQTDTQQKGADVNEQLTPRERVRLALEHQVTDRVPISMVCSGINGPALEDLDAYVARERNISASITDEGLLPKQDGDKIWVEVKAMIDDKILRSAAKVAFNYLTKTAGISFVLPRAFDAIRCYIRYGVDPGYHIVRIDQHPILADDTVTTRHTNGHLITTGWSPDRRHIVGQVSLFNWATYRVSLARGFSGLWRELRSGHHFNIESLDVEPLLGLPRHLL